MTFTASSPTLQAARTIDTADTAPDAERPHPPTNPTAVVEGPGRVSRRQAASALLQVGAPERRRVAVAADKVTAAGARRWHDANICVLSYRLVTATTAAEILQAFLTTPADPETARALDTLAALEEGR
ncbi:RpiB/LacA/LacB family sugar-phosphate isomerase [Frankia sp. Cr1]|uniref:RpiB/LacA/LacB family sugar-phosphate isomerase n=1 Tax=Frankia sp. Cr1 TaxID=3073931 RepID=UPI002AD2D1F7|nr:RpiB/LacA/LacB family sugar-phosphate isomerase [Frankia sp. Cr1]